MATAELSRREDQSRRAQPSADLAGCTDQAGRTESSTATAQGDDRLRCTEPAAAAAECDARLCVGLGLACWLLYKRIVHTPEREFHEALLEAATFDDLPGKGQGAILKAERNAPKPRGCG
jgi:hypothetical protein